MSRAHSARVTRVPRRNIASDPCLRRSDRETQVVYVDTDALVLESIDELFALDCDFAAAPDIFPPDKFNARVGVRRQS